MEFREFLLRSKTHVQALTSLEDKLQNGYDREAHEAYCRRKRLIEEANQEIDSAIAVDSANQGRSRVYANLRDEVFHVAGRTR